MRPSKLRTTSKGLELELDNVADGAHKVRIQAHPSRVFGDTVDETVTIQVDTRKPELVLNRVPPGWRPITEISGRVEPGSKLALSYEGRRVVVKPTSGAFALDADLPDGRTTVKLIASDRAGNRSVITRTVAVDGTPPRLHIDRVPALVGTPHPTLRGSLDDASPVVVQAKLDGVSVALRGPDGKALLGEGAVKGRFSLPLQRLAQGVHRLSITAIDSAGNVSTAEAGPFTVDSTEKLHTSSVLGMGARGADVVQLERRLKAFGVYKGSFTRFYNERTEAAVRLFQSKHELPVTGIATPQLLQLSAERIVVHLKRFRVDADPRRQEGLQRADRDRRVRVPDADRPLRDHGQDQEPDLGAAELPLGRRPGTRPAGRQQSARDALDRYERTRHRLPRDADGVDGRDGGLARLHAHAPRGRGAALRARSRGYAGRHRGISAADRGIPPHATAFVVSKPLSRSFT